MKQPIYIKIKNLTSEKQDVSLFSFTKKINKNVSISSNADGVDYDFIKKSLYANRYSIELIRVQSIFKSLIEKVLHVRYKDVFGNAFSSPIKCMDYFNPFQFQEDIIDIQKSVTLQYGSEIDITLNGNEVLVILLFQHSLNDKSASGRAGDKYEIFECINIKNLNILDEVILQPEWEANISLIRTVGFYAKEIFIGDKKYDCVKNQYCGDAVGQFDEPIFLVDKTEPHIPMRIKIPENANGYILFYKNK